MDLIYADKDRRDIGVLHVYELDLAFGADENSFECRVHANDHCCEAGYYLYFEGTEYGGIIDSIKIDTVNEEITYSGRTWHGILASKVIMPLQSGEPGDQGDVQLKTHGKNLFDPDALVDGYVSANGTLVAKDNIRNEGTTPFIDIEGASSVAYSAKVTVDTNSDGIISWLALCFYDDSQSIVGSRISTSVDAVAGEEVSGEIVAEVPAGAKYVRCSLRRYSKPVQAQLEIGDSVTTYEAHSMVDRYLVISGDANQCISFLLERVGLRGLFSATSTLAGTNINQYQFHRYTDAYSGIVGMLKSAGLKLHIDINYGKAILSALPRHDYSQEEEFDSDIMEFQMQKNYNTVNHLVCLGGGELENRLVVHLYADSEGNIGRTQTLFDEDEYTAVYDYSAVESEDDLIADGTEYLEALCAQAEMAIDFDSNEDIYDVGDTVSAVESMTKMSLTAEIVKKMLTVKRGQTTISYEVK